MATNILTIDFTPCVPAPANGYKAYYRPTGTTGAYRAGGTFAGSPAIINDDADAEGTMYEGYIQSDCGNGNLGAHVTFATSPAGEGSPAVSVYSVDSQDITRLEYYFTRLDTSAPSMAQAICITFDVYDDENNLVLPGRTANIPIGQTSDCPIPSPSSNCTSVAYPGGSIQNVVSVFC